VPASSAAPVPPTCEATTPGGPVFIAEDCVDPALSQPYTDIDEQRTTTDPATNVTVSYRYIHGGFTGTSARFAFYFPAPAQYKGRFFESTYPTATQEDADRATIAFAISNGAYVVSTNNAGGVTAAPVLGGYRVNAASAKYSRVVAAQVYRTSARPRGYIYGASGGAYQTVGAVESTEGVWDGAVPRWSSAIGALLLVPASPREGESPVAVMASREATRPPLRLCRGGPGVTVLWGGSFIPRGWPRSEGDSLHSSRYRHEKGSVVSSPGSETLGAIFAFSSVLVPYCMGAIASAGAIASGRAPAGGGAADPWSSWINPTSIIGGVLAQWPYVLPTSLKVSAAAAPTPTLTTVLVVFDVAAVVTAPSLALLYVLDQHNLLPEEGTASSPGGDRGSPASRPPSS
jgi:hypothetical protein